MEPSRRESERDLRLVEFYSPCPQVVNAPPSAASAGFLRTSRSSHDATSRQAHHPTPRLPTEDSLQSRGHGGACPSPKTRPTGKRLICGP